MEKYLFTDGTNVIREVQSKEELQSLIQSSGDTGKIRIWIFSTSEWITCAEFSKHSVANVFPLEHTVNKEQKKKAIVASPKPAKRTAWPVKFFIMMVTGGAIFLVYNFTRIKWNPASPLSAIAGRPENVPLMSMDSLIQIIETMRNQKLDKVTNTNLRIRNTWPDRIELQLNADRNTRPGETKFYNVELSIDNSTGYNIDNAIVELKNWKNNEAHSTDTIQFSNIGYSAPAKRKLTAEYRGDSLSVSFMSLKAKSFNFCYSVDKESNSGNMNDRWFCRE